ncbi:malonate decarboxylase holo-[acyl-carrier-protein] synthase [soil metagenome]
MSADAGAAPQRQQLVWLTPAGWRQVRNTDREAGQRDCIEHWAAAGLPLVVTRQHEHRHLALGLAAPLAFDRFRIAIAIDREQVDRLGEFPAAARIERALPGESRASWRRLVALLAHLACPARVYGGHGWQALTGMRYVHEDSDIDLLMPVATPARADAVCAALIDLGPGLPRLDGELLFPDGAAIAWREWLQRRSGQADRLLVKRTGGAALESFDFAEPSPAC